MIWLLITVLLIFRWPLFGWLVGAVKMYFLDAIMWTIFSAYWFTHTNPLPWLGYIIGTVSVLFAVDSGSKYLKASELERKINEEGSSNNS